MWYFAQHRVCPIGELRRCEKHTNIAAVGFPTARMIPIASSPFSTRAPISMVHSVRRASEAFSRRAYGGYHAINNATGVRIYELPATKEKVKEGLDILAKGGKINPPRSTSWAPTSTMSWRTLRPILFPTEALTSLSPWAEQEKRFFQPLHGILT